MYSKTEYDDQGSQYKFHQAAKMYQQAATYLVNFHHRKMDSDTIIHSSLLTRKLMQKFVLNKSKRNFTATTGSYLRLHNGQNSAGCRLLLRTMMMMMMMNFTKIYMPGLLIIGNRNFNSYS